MEKVAPAKKNNNNNNSNTRGSDMGSIPDPKTPNIFDICSSMKLTEITAQMDSTCGRQSGDSSM